MSVKCATAFSQAVEDAEAAAREIAASIRAEVPLDTPSVGVLFASVEYDLEQLIITLRHSD